MRLASGVLEGVDTVAPASDEGVATDAEVPHLVALNLGHLDDPVGGVLGGLTAAACTLQASRPLPARMKEAFLEEAFRTDP